MTGVVGVLMLIIGLIMAISPYSFWYFRLGWKLKDAKPSDLALRAERFLGVIFVIVGSILIVSSCSSSHGKDHDWADHFKERLSAGQLQEINIGLFNPVTLTDEETKTVTGMMQHAELRPMDFEESSGASNIGEIIFKDGTRLELIIFGSSGGIELQSDSTDAHYEIVSDKLENWFRSNYTNQ
ncbi:hypothetical protein SAMN05720606_11582 [Paenibacillus polysaccharolyticus]|uniref:DUF6199 domain-containing protein n=1 Tax=Paenibacillus polysaccharolyticus TaxID=582692 RepID=A0A1G5KIC6_9BACL|nr:DUF6199 family natural product biosynthesis protein [Paenibacillus polysaccharolyticus]SCZ00373.1 hypothetical protein SAMN05720606_11582 [Paenibacillus polysaccharolyticus]